MTIQQLYQKWLDNENLSPVLKKQLLAMNEEEKRDAFKGELEFGTAGIRGVLGPGTNRMNIYNVRRATLGFIKFLKNHSSNKLEQGVIIAHDNRHFSEQFSLEAANLLIKNGIKAYLFKNNELKPTPLLSYSIRKLNAIAGIVITASHNPPEYNGYKIYDNNGCQFLPDATDIIAQNMHEVGDGFDLDFKIDQSLISYVPQSVEIDYQNDIKNLQLYPHDKRDIKIVFSNQHGTSRDFVVPILTSSGYTVIPVKEQWDFDPDFSGKKSPNPESEVSFELAIKYAKENNADLIIINDPDSDRVGIAVKHNGKYTLLNGNETGPILLEYLLSHYKNRSMMPKNPVMYNTFVTSNLSDLIAESYGLKVIKTLTGFKWMANEIAKESERNLNFAFAFEESYGYVISDFIRDKDGIQAAMILAEACDFYKKQQKTFIDVLEDIYQKFGYFYCHTVNVTLKGEDGKQKIKAILDTLRNEKIDQLNNTKLIKKEDYLDELYNMPKQNLLKFYFADKSWFAVRASGTEPKIKFYFVCVGQNLKEGKAKMEKMYQDLNEKYLKIKE